MIWNRHSAFTGLHAPLSASKSHWVNYDDDKFDRIFVMQQAAARGTRLHDLAAQLIREKINLPRTNATLNKYVNDCIGFRMRPEQILFYSVNAYGTADAIKYQERAKKLRIFDLKTGSAMVSFKQLMMYAALFCLEYGVNPFDIEIELRIYQSDDVQILVADPDEIMHIMQQYKLRDRRIDELRREEDEL